MDAVLDVLSGDILVGADVNARSTVWHDIRTDSRGDIVVDFISQRNLRVHNKAGTLTFRNRGTACLDVTLSSNNTRVICHPPPTD